MSDNNNLPVKLKVPTEVEVGTSHLSLIARGLNAVIKKDFDTYYSNGLNSFADKFYTDAITWFLKGALGNHAPSQRALGCMFEKGLGTQQSSEQAFCWFKKAADQGYAGGEYSLGVMYMYGRYVEMSKEQALYWLTKSAHQGYAEAQCFLGAQFWEEELGLTIEQAIFWLKKAAEQGDQSAQHFLSGCYKDGEGVEQSYTQAVYWLKESSKEVSIEPEKQLAFLHNQVAWLENYYIESNVKNHYRDKYTCKGNVYAQEDLGDIYRDGKFVDQSYENAAYWYQKSADQGWRIAQYEIGYLYENGLGVEKNLEVAIDLYKKSSEQGNANSSLRLKALGVPLPSGSYL